MEWFNCLARVKSQPLSLALGPLKRIEETFIVFAIGLFKYRENIVCRHKFCGRCVWYHDIHIFLGFKFMCIVQWNVCQIHGVTTDMVWEDEGTGWGLE